jgi:hypothetical protein
MPLPNAQAAIIEPEKVRDYLLSHTHPIGRFKAAFFSRLGFVQDQWEQLERELRRHAKSGRVDASPRSEYGQKYVVRGEMRGPLGQNAEMVSVWILRDGDEAPRFVTAYPGG